MPTVKDDKQVETKEVAEQVAGGAAVTGPSQADVAASEAFGEKVETNPFAELDQAKADAQHAREEEARKKLEEAERKRKEAQDKKQLSNLGDALETAGKLGMFFELAKAAYAQNQEQLGDRIKNFLARMNNPKEDRYLSNDDIQSTLGDLFIEAINSLTLDSGLREGARMFCDKQIETIAASIKKEQGYNPASFYGDISVLQKRAFYDDNASDQLSAYRRGVERQKKTIADLEKRQSLFYKLQAKLEK